MTISRNFNAFNFKVRKEYLRKKIYIWEICIKTKDAVSELTAQPFNDIRLVDK